MLTPHEAQLYLAGKLPERIFKSYRGNDVQFYWEHWEGTLILETEWQQIALWVEEKMTDEQWDKFQSALYPHWLKLDPHPDYSRWISQLNYLTAATAMKESGL